MRSKINSSSMQNGDPEMEIVISGISGAFPESNNVQEFRENLFSKKDLITPGDRRRYPEFEKKTYQMGKLKEINKFDSDFFGLPFKHADYLNPGARMVLEKTYEAILDAGYNPKHFAGSNTGVFIACVWGPTTAIFLEPDYKADRNSIDQICTSVIANRISFWLKARGPSLAIDAACSSSLSALNLAYNSMKAGYCDAAIVGACNVSLLAGLNEFYDHAGVVNYDRSRSFDDAGDGFVRSECVAAVLLQRRKDARRIYARVVHVKTACDGNKKEGIHEPSVKLMKQFFDEFYEECGVPTDNVKFIEAHATGTKVGDTAELKAIDAIFSRDGTTLLIGSVKSNMGHSEAASGLCSIVKLLITFESGFIPPNLHYKTPRAGIKSLKNGKMKVVTDVTPWDGGLAATSSFGYAGTNSHALLESNTKIKPQTTPSFELPFLITVSGRTEEAVEIIFNDLEQKPLDAEYVALLHEIFKDAVPKHPYRGYTVLQRDRETSIKNIEKFPGRERPVWFVFSGMGSHWSFMGKSLMKIPVIAESLRKSHDVLISKGINLITIITETDIENTKDINDFIDIEGFINACVGIVAIQIALADLLKSIGIKPSGIFGHSLGEISCAYADDCITAEQAILLAYYRGLIIPKHQPTNGLMASVGLAYYEIVKIKPPEIDIACHNALDNCTISGPFAVVKEFITSLQKDNVFVREVHAYGIAAHSRYNQNATLILKDLMQNIIKDPKLRSDRWVSTSFLREDWETDAALQGSAEYFAQNIVGTVYFEEACYEIPNDAIVIEIAPHGILQSILRRSLDQSVTNISLTSKNHDNATHVLTTLGKFYTLGGNFCASKLYPPVEFPVSRGTQMISPLIRWDHTRNWHVFEYDNQKNFKNGIRRVNVSLENEEQKFLAGYVVNGQNLYPVAGYLIMAWETLGFLLGKPHTDLSVIFQDVQLLKMTILPEKGSIEYMVNISKNNNQFVIMESGEAVATGKISVLETEEHTSDIEQNIDDSHELPLTFTDIYKEIRLRGYDYEGEFCEITYLNQEGTIGRISWNNNFLIFLDNIIQMFELQQDDRNILVPTAIKKLIIHTKTHFKMLEELNSENPELVADINTKTRVISCGGMKMHEVRFASFTKKDPIENPLIDKFEYVPYINPELPNLETALITCAQMLSENLKDNPIKIMEMVDDLTNLDGALLSQLLLKAYKNIPMIEPEVIVTSDKVDLWEVIKEKEEIHIRNTPLPCDESCSVVIASYISRRTEVLYNCFRTVKVHGFLLMRESLIHETKEFDNLGLKICWAFAFNNERILLLRKLADFTTKEPIVVKISNESYSWITELQKYYDLVRMNEDQLLILLSEKEAFSGILGFTKSLCQEIQHENIRCFYIMDETAPPFSITHPFYKQQIQKHVLINIYRNGNWCGFYHLPYHKPEAVLVPHAYVNILEPGDFHSVKWIQGPLNPKTCTNERNELIHVFTAAINFHDIAVMTRKSLPNSLVEGRLQQDNSFGCEFSGKTNDGRRFMGIVAKKGTTNLVECDTSHMWPVPDTWTLDDAATVPVAYAMALYALLECARLRQGDSILIHSAAGGVGLAALNVCLHYDCNIFVTVSSPEKSEFILQNYAAVPKSHIGNSRDTTFEQMIQSEMRGKGVRIVLNTLTGDKVQASIRCLAENGHFLELAKPDFSSDNVFDRPQFIKTISFHVINWPSFVHDKIVQQIVHPLMQKAIDNGIVKPLPRTIFLANDIESAYRFFTSGKNMGKTLIKIRKEELNSNNQPEILFMEAVPQFLCNAEKSYIICGGLGGFGLELADWLVLRGAKNILLNSHREPQNGYQVSRIRRWRSYGVNVKISVDDIISEKGVERLLRTANNMAPVSAIFNLAAVAITNYFNKETEESFAQNAAPKTTATILLDKLSRQLCPNLDHFVAFSSVVAFLGGASQTNYTTANSVMERVCEKRKAENLPALAIQWGPIAGVGILTEKLGIQKDILLVGLQQQTIQSCLRTLEILLIQPHTIVLSEIIGSKKVVKITNKTIAEVVANILGIQNMKTVNIYAPLTEFGLDSLSSVEIKNTIEREFQIYVTNEEIKEFTFAQLYKMETKSRRKQNHEEKITHQNDTYDPGFLYLKKLIRNFKLEHELVVRMPTLLHNGDRHEVSAQEYPTVFFLPGLDGYAKYSEDFFLQFNIQILCLQYDIINVPDSVEEQCARLAAEIEKRLQPDQEFWLIGYSYGVTLALETAKQLEEKGRRGRVWLIDADVAVNKKQVVGVNEDLAQKIKAHLMDEIIDENSVYIKELWPRLAGIVKNELFQTDDDNPQNFMNNIHKYIDPELINEFEELPLFTSALRKRIETVLQYKGLPRKSIKSFVTLLKASRTSSLVGKTLPQYLQQPLRTHVIEGDHFTIIKKKTASKAINNDLKDILKNKEQEATASLKKKHAECSATIC